MGKKEKKEKKQKKPKQSDSVSAVAMKGDKSIRKFLLALIDLVAGEYTVPFSEWPHAGTVFFPNFY